MSDSAHATNGSEASIVTDSSDGAGSNDTTDAADEAGSNDEAAPTEEADAGVGAADSDGFTFDDLSVVMGTYNEEEAIGTVLDDIDEVTDGKAEVVCVDGSSDRTAEIAREHGARVVRSEERRVGKECRL